MAESKTESAKIDAYYEEQLQLHGSDHPGMVLVSSLLTDSNYRLWRNAVVTALESKDKLGIVDGTCFMPSADSKFYRRWRKVNSMVVSWVKNSISKELIQHFAYINDAAELWTEIEERYGTSDIAMLFQIKKEIANVKQENLGITECYGRLKDLTDQMTQLRPNFSSRDILNGLEKDQSADFVKGAESAIRAMLKLCEERSMEDRSMEFLLGLNDVFHLERNQILLLEPSPSVNKIYSIMLKSEQNKLVVDHMGSDGIAMNVRGFQQQQWPKDNLQQWTRDTNKAKPPYRKDRNNLVCNYCKKAGHSIDNCFKLKGFPEWWDHTKKKGSAMAVQSSETPLEWNDNLTAAMEEIQRMMKDKAVGEKKEMVNLAHLGDFAGP